MIRPGHPVVRGACIVDADEPCDGPHRRCLILWAGGGIFGLPLFCSVPESVGLWYSEAEVWFSDWFEAITAPAAVDTSARRDLG